MIRTYRARPATGGRSEHAEGPMWDARTGQLLWIDQYAGLVVVADFDREQRSLEPVTVHELGAPVGAVVPATAGGWLVAVRHGFGHLAADGTLTLLDQPEDDAREPMRMNDGKCDAAGRFWAGSMAFAKTPGAGTLYRLDPDRRLVAVLPGTTISNGLAWTDAGDEVFFIDTPTRRIDRFRITPEGALTDRRPAVELPEGAGDPDGMCIDADGALWVALWGGGAVRRYSPDGELLAVVEVDDAPQVSSCCFGGADGRTLFITTSQEGMDDDARAAASASGRLFCVDVDAWAPPAAAFAGALP